VRKFKIEISGSAVIEIDDSVIAAVDDEWRSQFYWLTTPEQVAEHVAFNMIKNGIQISQMDGFADQNNSSVRMSRDELDFDATEIK
jgi:hypothetical protein